MAQAAEVVLTQDIDAALQVEKDDDRMDELHRMIFQHLMDDRWQHGVETAVDVTLSAATTNGSPTTPSPWLGAWSTCDRRARG